MPTRNLLMWLVCWCWYWGTYWRQSSEDLKSLIRYQIVWFIKLIFCSDYEHKVWSGFWSWILVNILKLKFGQYSENDFILVVFFVNIYFWTSQKPPYSTKNDVWLRLWSWSLVKIMKLSFCAKSRTWDVTSRSYFGKSTKPSGPLCVWECLLLCFINFSVVIIW